MRPSGAHAAKIFAVVISSVRGLVSCLANID